MKLGYQPACSCVSGAHCAALLEDLEASMIVLGTNGKIVKVHSVVAMELQMVVAAAADGSGLVCIVFLLQVVPGSIQY